MLSLDLSASKLSLSSILTALRFDPGGLAKHLFERILYRCSPLASGLRQSRLIVSEKARSPSSYQWHNHVTVHVTAKSQPTVLPEAHSAVRFSVA